MIVLRLLYTALVMVVVIWLLRSGNPVGGLLVVPAAAVWLRREAESGRLAAAVRRGGRHSRAERSCRQPARPGRLRPEYSSLGSMLVAIAIRLVRLYIAAISATSQASSSERPTSSSDRRSSRVISTGVSVSFSA